MKCGSCAGIVDVCAPIEKRNDARNCPCGGTLHRTYRGVRICPQTTAEAFFGGKYWNGHNTAEKVASMKAAERRAEASWRPDPNRELPAGMSPLAPAG